MATNKNMEKTCYRFSPFQWTKTYPKPIMKVQQKCLQRYSTVSTIDFEPVLIREVAEERSLLSVASLGNEV